MLCKAIRLGCEKYHVDTGFNPVYDNYMENKNQLVS